MTRGFLSAAERERLITYPSDISDWDLGRFFTLSPRDLEIVNQ